MQNTDATDSIANASSEAIWAELDELEARADAGARELALV